jgi:hypothetical protein
MIDNHIPDEVYEYRYPGCSFMFAGLCLLSWVIIFGVIILIAKLIY